MATVYDALAVAIQTPGIHGTQGVPVCLWGPPGVGKSARIHALCARLAQALPGGLHEETVIAALRGPEDFAGWPKIEEVEPLAEDTYRAAAIEAGAADPAPLPRRRSALRMIPPDWAVRAASAKRAVVFLDEASTAERAVQKALLRAVCEGVVGDLRLPPTVAWVLAANEVQHAADGHTFAAAFANRMVHLDVPAPSAEEWGTYMLGGAAVDAQPPVLNHKRWATEFRNVRALGAQFAARRPGALHSVPESEEAQGREWASPRTWEMGLRAYAAGLAVDSPEIALTLLSGAVGPIGTEFAAWAQEMDLPDPVALLRGQVPFVVDRARLDRAIVTLSAAATSATEIPTATSPSADAAAAKKEREALIEAWYGLCEVALAEGCLDVCVPGASAIARRYKGMIGPKAQKILGQGGLLGMLQAAGVK